MLKKSHIRESMFQQLELFERLERFELFISLLVVLHKSKLKRRAGTVIGYGPQPPAVRLYNRTADCQSHAHSLRLGGVESIKDPSHAPRVQANA